MLAFKRVLRPVSSSPVQRQRLLADLKHFIQVLPDVRRNLELHLHANTTIQSAFSHIVSVDELAFSRCS